MSFDLALIDSDLSIKADGTIRTVERAEKLKQDIVKIILTPITSVKFHLWYGSAISEDTVGSVIPDNLLFQRLAVAINDSLNKLQKLQRAQSTYQRVSLSEILAQVKDVFVQRNITDARQVNVIVMAMSKDFNAVEEVFTVSP